MAMWLVNRVALLLIGKHHFCGAEPSERSEKQPENPHQ